MQIMWLPTGPSGQLLPFPMPSPEDYCDPPPPWFTAILVILGSVTLVLLGLVISMLW